MAIIPVPARFAFSKVDRFQLLRAGSTLRSRYNAARQKIVFPYAIWIFEATLAECDGATAAAIRSFLTELEGIKNEFRLPVPGHSKPSTGYLANRALTVAAAARAMSITVGGGAAGIPYLGVGDYFVIQDELKIVNAPVAFNGAGNATITFKPGLRKAAAIGVNVVVANPTLLLEAQDEDIASWALTPPLRQNSKVDFIEAISL